jgi:polar amino acid transport system substrate-binding protein
MFKKTALLCAVLAVAIPSLSLAADAKPKLIKNGEIRFLTNPIYPPMEFVNPSSGVYEGFDIDLGNAIAKDLNLRPVWTNSSFEQLQSSLQTGRGDVILSGISDNVKRQKSMDFVDYITSGPIFFTLSANASKYKNNVDLCGKEVAGSRSASFPGDVAKWSDTNCVAKGLPAIKFSGTADSNAARLGMKQGRYDAVVQGVETIAYQMHLEPSTYTLVGKPILTNDVFGIATKKTNPQLRTAIAKSLDKLIKNGTYAQLLKKWGLVHNAVPHAVINGVK